MDYIRITEADNGFMLSYTDPEIREQNRKSDSSWQDPERQRSGDYGQDVAMEFFGYLAGIVAQRRAEPRGDLMSVVANATLDGKPLSDMETLSYGMLLAAAGHDTTSSSVGVGMMQLALNPGEFAKLQADPALIPAAAQEMFRWATPVRHFMRTAAADTVLAGQQIKAGESVCLMYLSGNRDERAFDALFEIAHGNLRATDHLALKSLEIALLAGAKLADANHVAEARKALWP